MISLRTKFDTSCSSVLKYGSYTASSRHFSHSLHFTISHSTKKKTLTKACTFATPITAHHMANMTSEM